MEDKETLFFGRKAKPEGYIDVREIYELAKIKMEDQEIKMIPYKQWLKIALNCEKHNIKVVQFHGKQPSPKMDRMFEPYYNIWTLYRENDKFWNHLINHFNYKI